MSITPKDWTRFQHYKNRAPAWIKFHRSLLDNYDYARLPLACRALAPMLWLLASEYDEGRITASTEEIAFRLRTTEAELVEALSPLIERGFFTSDDTLADRKPDASAVLAECLPRVREEEEREKDAAPPGAQVISIPQTPEKAFFDQAVQVVGNNGRSLAAQLLKAKGGNVALAHSALLLASTKSNPREYLGAIIRGRDGMEDLRARGEAW
jgi:hypothetical protein